MNIRRSKRSRKYHTPRVPDLNQRYRYIAGAITGPPLGTYPLTGKSRVSCPNVVTERESRPLK